MSKKAFKSGKEFIAKIEEYIEFCTLNERLVNVSGFCRRVGMGRRTFYDQVKYYPEEYELVRCYLEDEALNDKTASSTALGLYLKNRMGFVEKVENKNTNDNVNKNVDLSHLSVEQIRELLKNEN